MNAETFKKLFLPFHRKLYCIAFHYLESKADAEDMVQETYLKLWQRKEELESVVNIEAFAVKIIRNLCNDTRHFSNDNQYKLLMQVKDSSDNVDFFVKKSKSDNLIQELVMLVKQPDGFVMIQLQGKMTLDDIKQITKSNNGKK